MRKGRIIFIVFVVAVLFLVGINHNLVYYGLVQAKGQLNIIWQSEPIKKVLSDPDFPDSLKIKLKFIEDVKQYAVQELGLKGVRNYTTYYDQKGKELMWVLSACQPFRLESYSWDFPILGSFTYKGFFKYEMAVKEMKKLRGEGLDASLRTAGGWSTLGILKDPVLSNMLEKNTGSLADLIIHELTHGTLFVKDSIELNENLATFIGNTGAKRFLEERYGSASPELDVFNKKLEDHSKFTRYVLMGAAQLDSLYASFPEGMYYEDKLKIKRSFIKEFLKNVQDLTFHDQEYHHYFDDFTPDNTFFMSFLRYRGGQEHFELALKEEYHGDLRTYIQALKRMYGR